MFCCCGDFMSSLFLCFNVLWTVLCFLFKCYFLNKLSLIEQAICWLFWCTLPPANLYRGPTGAFMRTELTPTPPTIDPRVFAPFFQSVQMIHVIIFLTVILNGLCYKCFIKFGDITCKFTFWYVSYMCQDVMIMVSLLLAY